MRVNVLTFSVWTPPLQGCTQPHRERFDSPISSQRCQSRGRRHWAAASAVAQSCSRGPSSSATPGWGCPSRTPYDRLPATRFEIPVSCIPPHKKDPTWRMRPGLEVFRIVRKAPRKTQTWNMVVVEQGSILYSLSMNTPNQRVFFQHLYLACQLESENREIHLIRVYIVNSQKHTRTFCYGMAVTLFLLQ